METMGDRLRQAREEAGFPSARQAALKHQWRISTYSAHENGQNDFDEAAAKTYGRAFKVSAGWLLTGEGSKQKPGEARQRMVPVVGYVAAGAQAHFFDPGDLDDEVPAPEGSTDATVAVEIRGDSLGALFDRWLVFYDRVERPVTPELVNKLCVVGLEDGRILVKKVTRSRAKGLFHLVSNTEAPITDVAIEWAAKVKNMVPR